MKKNTSAKKVLKPPLTATLLNSIVNRLIRTLDVEKVILFDSFIKNVFNTGKILYEKKA